MNDQFKLRLIKIKDDLKQLFNISSDLLSQDEIEESVRSGVSFKGSQLLVLIFAIFIASLGLNVDSIPVIIGAMLISPLMGPIIGMGVAIGIQDYSMLKKGLKNITLAVIGSLLASAVYFLISPQYEDPSQLLARTSPSIYDVFIALFGGAAGILSIACKNKGQVMPGVAIATSLMPPLCTAGYGLATCQSQFFFGALYLFVTNMVFILFASWIGAKFMKFRKVVHENNPKYKRVHFLVYTIVLTTVVISVYLTIGMFQKTIFLNSINTFVNKDINFPNTPVLSHEAYISDGKKYLDLTLIGESLPKDSVRLVIMTKLDSVGLGDTQLSIKQGFELHSNSSASKVDNEKLFDIFQTQLLKDKAEIDSLRDVVSHMKSFINGGQSILPEVKILFPTIKDLAITQTSAISVEHETTDTVNLIIVNAPGGLNKSSQDKLKEYVSVRLNVDNVELFLNPRSFPWPEK